MSRHDVVDNLDMAYLFSVQNKMLPSDLDRRSLRISAICFEDDLHHVLWSHTASSGDIEKPVALKDENIPVNLLPEMAPQESIILTEVAAHWNPYINVGVGDQTWESILISSPRFVRIIPHTTLNPSNICPSAV